MIGCVAPCDARLLRRPSRGIVAFGACLLALLAVACNRKPAEDALQAAEQALAAAPEIATCAPEEFAAVSAILGEARASHAAGRYTDALRAVLPLPDRISAAAATAARRKQQSAAVPSSTSPPVP
jgi:hypothetical protein